MIDNELAQKTHHHLQACINTLYTVFAAYPLKPYLDGCPIVSTMLIISTSMPNHCAD
jgi:hypothetical protein